MSQYLSHLANLALNQMDVVQPRLASRFESQGDAVAPSPVYHGTSHHETSHQDTRYQETSHQKTMDQQEVISETAAPVVNRAARPIAQSFAPDHGDVRTVDKTPVQPQATTVIHQPKVSPSLIPAQTGFQPLPLQAASLQSAQQEKPAEPLQPTLKELQSQVLVKPELPALNPINTQISDRESAKPEFKEEHIETSLPLLTPVKVQRTTRTASIEGDVQPAASMSPTRYQDESKEFAVKPRNQELIAAQQTPSSQQLVPTSAQNSDQPAKPAAIKPESIRIQPLQSDFTGGVVQSRQTLAAAPVDITPPSIHVSIGRIEIRASQTSAPAIAKPRASSTMSLDDYLKQRGEKP